MNKNRDSSFERAIELLTNAKMFGTRVRFVFSHSTIGLFALDGFVDDGGEKDFIFLGADGCSRALVDRLTSGIAGVEEMPNAEFSFLLHFKLDGENFFTVAGLEPFPKLDGQIN